MRYTVIGMGKLGAPLAVLLSSRCGQTTGIDTNAELVQAINEGTFFSPEPGLAELLKETKLKATTSFEPVGESDVSFIIVPTPSTPGQPAFSNEYIIEALSAMAPFITRKPDYHLVVIVSTVMPGSMAQFATILEGSSNKKCGVDFGLCYNPQFIALGNVIEGMTNPDSVLIGESDKRAGNSLELIQLALTRKVDYATPPIRRMSWYNAEVAKLAVNFYITAKISIANMLAAICSQTPAGNVDAVTEFMGLDSRIGGKYLKGGLGFGGPCFSRDTRAFATLTGRSIANSVADFNTDYCGYITGFVDREILAYKRSKIAILGLSYKPNTPITEESPALILATQLEPYHQVVAYDPMSKWMNLPGWILVKGNITECLKDADLAIIAVPHTEFKNLQPSDFSVMKTPKILDCWRILDREKMKTAGIEYHAIGVNIP